MDLDFVRIECDITTAGFTQLTPLLYDALRSYEAHFKASCCHSLQKECTSCSEQNDCPYSQVFSQKLSSDPEIVRLHQKPPLPFTFYVRELNSKASTSTVTVGLVIIGSAVNYVKHFHAALLSLIEGIANSLPDVKDYSLNWYSLDYQSARHEVSSGTLFPDGVILLSAQHILDNSVHSDSARLIIKSPLRILCNGSIMHRIDFVPFFCSQLRRCSSIYAYYGSGILELDFVRLAEHAKNVAVFDDNIRYSQPTWSKRLNRAGLTGSAECAGLVEPMLSLLILGSHFNAGKGATFGAGFHEIEVL